MPNECVNNTVCDQKIKVIDEKINNITNEVDGLKIQVNVIDKTYLIKISEFDKDLALTKQSFMNFMEKMSTLPSAIVDLKETMNNVNNTISNNSVKTVELSSEVDGLKTSLSKIDEDGKFNIRVFIKTYWIPISIGLGALIWYGENYLR